MFKPKQYIKLFFYLPLSFMFASPSSVHAVDYTAVAGSVILIKNYSNQKITPEINIDRSEITHPTGKVMPLMGALVLPNSRTLYGCADANSVLIKDGWKGLRVTSNGIIAGVSGTINHAVAVIKQAGSDKTTTYRGGLSLDSRGFTSPIGDANPESVNNFCAGEQLPYDNSIISGAGFTGWGNYPAIFDGSVWLYVPIDITPGKYNLNMMGISQGSFLQVGFVYNSYLPITANGDTVTVIPPPCTISTETMINFDTSYENGKKKSAPINFRCGDTGVPSLIEAHVMGFAVSKLESSTELSLRNIDDQPGGVVRGYVGQNVDIANVNCTDTASSLPFDGSYGPKLGSVTNNINLSIPLVWQLCTKGSEVPGLATGSVVLDIGYK